MLAIGLPNVSEDLGLSQSTQTWVVDAYALTLASLLLSPAPSATASAGAARCSSASSIFGDRLAAVRVRRLAAVQLIAFRALTGVGGALIMPGTLSTITSVFPPEERARAVGIWAGFAGAGGTLGMLGAGWMLGHFSWQSIFYVTAVGVGRDLRWPSSPSCPTPARSEHVGLDPLGTVLSALAIGGLVLGIIEGPIRGWSDPLTIAGLVARRGRSARRSCCGSCASEHPLLDPRLFRHRGFATGSASLLVLFIALFGIFLVILQYLQLLLGYSAAEGGGRAAADDVRDDPDLDGGRAAVDALRAEAGRRHRAWSISAVGSLAFATLDAHSGYGALLVAQLILAVGIGLAMTPATNAIVSSLPTCQAGRRVGR